MMATKRPTRDAAQLSFAFPRSDRHLARGVSPHDVLLQRLLASDCDALSHAPRCQIVEALADALHVRVERCRLNTCGQLLYDRKHPLVLLNIDSNWRKQRFTLAHELAHFLVLRDLESEYGTDIAALVAEERGGTLKFERLIDALASRLLLPYDSFTAALFDLELQGIRGFQAAWRLREMYGASLTATVRRLVDVSANYVFLLCKRYSVPGKPPKLRIASSSSRRLGFIARHKSVPSEGPIAAAYELKKYDEADMLVSAWGHEPTVLRVAAVPTHPSLNGAYVLIDLRPPENLYDGKLVSLVLSGREPRDMSCRNVALPAARASEVRTDSSGGARRDVPSRHASSVAER